jgi:hypothetical protein
MSPQLPLERFVWVGNADGSGAKLTLASRHHRGTTEGDAGNVGYVELSIHPRFAEAQAASLSLPGCIRITSRVVGAVRCYGICRSRESDLWRILRPKRSFPPVKLAPSGYRGQWGRGEIHETLTLSGKLRVVCLGPYLILCTGIPLAM